MLLTPIFIRDATPYADGFSVVRVHSALNTILRWDEEPIPPYTFATITDPAVLEELESHPTGTIFTATLARDPGTPRQPIITDLQVVTDRF